ncbi:MAG: hypothetical protein GF411_06100 [Candidatus Lokiarchaeota archaeon]|nr:hypothetical protein [Candidatus Lokiarchaeota archaeon]
MKQKEESRKQLFDRAIGTLEKMLIDLGAQEADIMAMCEDFAELSQFIKQSEKVVDLFIVPQYIMDTGDEDYFNDWALDLSRSQILHFIDSCHFPGWKNEIFKEILNDTAWPGERNAIQYFESKMRELGKTDSHTGEQTLENRLSIIEGGLTILYDSHLNTTGSKHAEFENMHGSMSEVGEIPYMMVDISKLEKLVDRLSTQVKGIQDKTDGIFALTREMRPDLSMGDIHSATVKIARGERIREDVEDTKRREL